ncbi:MAG TPA: hydroxyacid dehydrogenase [Verrucomicrobia bacterium]|nr:MAG: hydroxyacid dehydrogenase [Lentisphaerae bacterium GWF2_57_35]HBA83067.1 hydroxyacid dehydrogenase [Verrucomicrobiota bacterium]
MDVFFFEAFEEEQAALQRYLPKGLQAGFTPKTIQETGMATPPAGLISLRTQSIIPPAWAPSLTGILSRSTGYDHLRRYVDLTATAVPCGYLPLYCARAVAEQALLLWLALYRKLPTQLRQFETFHRDGITGQECAGKCLAVFGVGHIGSEVVKIGKGLGMEVLGVDIVRRFAHVEYVEKDLALARADIVVCSMNLTKANAAYFQYDTLQACRRGVLFINIARGELAPSQVLLRALNEGLLGGVGIDVYNCESELAVSLRGNQTSSHPEVEATLRLKNHPQAILTPHNAFNTIEAVERKSEQSMEQVAHFFKTQSFLWPMPEA